MLDFEIGKRRFSVMAEHGYPVIIERDEDNKLIATCTSLKGCHSQADNMNDLLVRIKEAIELCIEVEGKAPEPLRFVGVHEVRIAS
jgi:predicted RNase H-like HicB family nuclease